MKLHAVVFFTVLCTPLALDAADAVQPALPIGPEDLLSLTVANCPELSRQFRVGSNGMLALPLLEKRLPAAGSLPTELEVVLADELKRQGILVQPVVSIAVAEYRSRPVSVVGAVRHPVQFQALSGVTLLEALAKADGLAANAGPEILVTRKKAAPDGKWETETQRIPIRGLMDNADPALNVGLEGNEEVRVPEVGKFYIAGNVKRPGVFAMPDNADATVIKSVAVAEGLLPYSAKEAYIYRRVAGRERREEIPVPLRLILHRKAPDMQLLADDILYIPDNSGTRITANVLERLAGFGSSTASGILVWGRK